MHANHHRVIPLFSSQRCFFNLTPLEGTLEATRVVEVGGVVFVPWLCQVCKRRCPFHHIPYILPQVALPEGVVNWLLPSSVGQDHPPP